MHIRIAGRERRLTYNIADVIDQLMYKRTPEQRDQVKDVIREMQNNKMVTNLIIELADRAVDNKKRPTDILGLAVMYGIVIGLNLKNIKEKVN